LHKRYRPDAGINRTAGLVDHLQYLRMPQNRNAWFILAILFAINTLNFFDRLIIAAVGEPIRKEFGLSDSSLGLLSTAFILLYAVVGIPFGRLVDTQPRKYLLAGGVFVWSLLTAASGIVQSYWQLFAMRLGVGVGEASCAPAAVSLIGDLFPAEKRARAMSIFMLGLPIGIALSFAISGTVTKAYGWRTAFLVAGIPGILLAILALLIREPDRAAAAAPTRSPFRSILASRTMRWIIVSGILHNFSLYAVSSFLTPYLMRYHGLDIQNAGFAAMVINGILTLPGLLLGGWVGDAANARRPNGAMMVAMAACLLSAPLFFLSLGVGVGSTVPFILLMGGGYALMYFYYPIVYATIAEITPADRRGTAMSVYFLAMYLLGGALGPYVVGMISDHFTKRAAGSAGVFEAAALEPFRAAGLQSAMYIIPVLCVVLAVVLWIAARSSAKVVLERE
jgi:predicted MFS family arabinose efflux permease